MKFTALITEYVAQALVFWRRTGGKKEKRFGIEGILDEVEEKNECADIAGRTASGDDDGGSDVEVDVEVGVEEAEVDIESRFEREGE